MKTQIPLAVLLALSLGGCERINELANQQKFNGKAVGAACRHSGRALEDCFRRNPRIAKADIYAGWKEMNEYMAKNKLEVVAPPPDEIKKPESTAGTVEISGGSADADGDKTPSAATAEAAPAAESPSH